MPERRDMNDLDRALDQALRAVRADADPRPLARAMARLDVRAGMPGWLEWASRPRALAVSLALFAACTAIAVTLALRAPAVASDTAATLANAIQTEIEGATPGDAGDGGGTQADSGRAL